MDVVVFFIQVTQICHLSWQGFVAVSCLVLFIPLATPCSCVSLLIPSLTGMASMHPILKASSKTMLNHISLVTVIQALVVDL